MTRAVVHAIASAYVIRRGVIRTSVRAVSKNVWFAEPLMCIPSSLFLRKTLAANFHQARERSLGRCRGLFLTSRASKRIASLLSRHGSTRNTVAPEALGLQGICIRQADLETMRWIVRRSGPRARNAGS